MKIRLNEGEFRVVMVNLCRALCQPLTKSREVIIPGRFDEPDKKFMAQTSAVSISPNSECEIIR